MEYIKDNNSYQLTTKEMEIILDALSYVHWSDKSISPDDRNFISNLYESLDKTRITNH